MEFDKNKIKTKIAISKIKEENDIVMEKRKARSVFKTVATAMAGIILSTGVVSVSYTHLTLPTRSVV